MYSVGATYQQNTPNTMVLQGRFVPANRHVTATAVYSPTDKTTLKAVSRLVPDGDQVPSICTLDARYSADDYTIQGKVHLGKEPTSGVSYFQSLTPSVCAGGEATWVPSKAKLNVSVGARASSDMESVAIQAAQDQGGKIALAKQKRV